MIDQAIHVECKGVFMKPSINKTQYNKNLDIIMSSNLALSDLLEIILSKESSYDSEFGEQLIEQIRNGQAHLMNMNMLLKNLKR